jgi:hypothetical protein
VLAAEHLAGLGRLDVGLELVDPPGQIGVYRLPRFSPLDEDAEVVCAALQRLGERQFVGQPAAALLQLLCFGVVLPEVGVERLLVNAFELGAVSWDVKDSSADRRNASPGRGNA